MPCSRGRSCGPLGCWFSALPLEGCLGEGGGCEGSHGEARWRMSAQPLKLKVESDADRDEFGVSVATSSAGAWPATSQSPTRRRLSVHGGDGGRPAPAGAKGPRISPWARRSPSAARTLGTTSAAWWVRGMRGVRR
ncbi:unnamed protein product [Prorocentrum cordatum]|uniref:Uncharacterized protein n=1 Tax=Prorocentrum cordatum TaxID=2364126 RepID=A0ABN9WZG2_9DINO|nr:unnamed protein product [Polarella glacialis]